MPYLVGTMFQLKPASCAAYPYLFSESLSKCTNISVKLQFLGSRDDTGLKHEHFQYINKGIQIFHYLEVLIMII